MKYDRKIELHKSRKEYRQRQIRVKEDDELRTYDRVIRHLDNDIQVARRNNQLRERKMYLKQLPSHPMRVRATSHFEETGELDVSPPFRRVRVEEVR